MAASMQAAATLMQPTKVGVPSRTSLQLRSSNVSKAFGLEPVASSRLTCSLQTDLKEFAHKCVDASKIAGFALATSALVVSVCISCLGLLLNLYCSVIIPNYVVITCNWSGSVVYCNFFIYFLDDGD